MIFDRMRTVYADGRVVDVEGETTYGASPTGSCGSPGS
jgi:hypothetical protein